MTGPRIATPGELALTVVALLIVVASVAMVGWRIVNPDASPPLQMTPATASDPVIYEENPDG